MVIGIGHYRQNIPPTEAINGGIKSLNIIDERGTAASALNRKEFSLKTRQATHTRIDNYCTGTTMTMIGIGHYVQNIAATASKNGGIKSPDNR